MSAAAVLVVVLTSTAVGCALAIVVDRASTSQSPHSVSLAVIVSNVAVWLLFAWRFDDQFATLLAFLVLASVLVTQSWIDLREHRLPRHITFVGIVVGGGALVVAALTLDEPERIWMAALGAFIAMSLIGGIYLLSNAIYGDDVAFGFGDVVLSPLLGMYLGWLNPGLVAPGLFVGFLFASLVAVVAIVSRRATGRSHLPFGPFLTAGTVASVLVGQPVVDRLAGG